MQYRQNSIIFFTALIMLISLFTGRSTLSIAVILFVVVCFIHRDIKKQLRTFFSAPLLWSVSLLFVLPLVSGIWSEDRKLWMEVVQVKLPLLVLPLAFASPFSFSKKQWEWLAVVFVLLAIAGSIWSMSYYLPDMKAVNESYLRAKTMPTPLKNDHVRFSWFLNISFLLTLWLCWQKRHKKTIAVLIGFLALWQLLFLHILAARTGLLCLYISLFTIAVWFGVRKTRRVYGMALLVVLVALPVIAWFIFPTFQNKLKFFRYDFSYFKDAHYLQGGNDAMRAISVKAGWHVMMADPVKGAGFGDIARETKEWYDVHYPRIQSYEKILPSNEWLIYGAGCGIPGLLIFTMVMLIPFLTRVTHRWTWWLLNSLVIISFLFDIGLETQFGIFIYLFVVLAVWKFEVGSPRPEV